MKKEAQHRPLEPRLPDATRSFSITLLVSEEVAARWPEWFTTEKLMGGIYNALGIAGAPARKRALPRMVIGVTALLLVELLAAGVMLGYVGASGFYFLFGASNPSPVVSRSPSVAQDQRKPQAPPAAAPSSSRPSVVPPRGPGRAGEAPAALFRVQAGAYRHRENAETLMRKLRQDGFNAYISHSAGLYKVQIGTFRDRKDADRLAEELRAKHYDAFVTQNPPLGN